MNKFKIKVISQANSIIVILLFFAILFPLLLLRNRFLPTPLGSSYAILLTIPFLFLFYFLFQKVATGRTEWVVDDSGVSIIWTKKFMLSKVKDINLKWKEIEKFKKGFDPNYYILYIYLVEGRSITFIHSYLTFKDDFESLLKALYQTFDEKRKK